MRPIIADPTKIHEIIMNLGTNAAHSIGEKGAISIRCRIEILGETLEGRVGDSPPGRYAVIDVTDTGSGMSKDTLSHIFEPFYSEKGVGRGTGMGLAVVFGIVQSHEGNIRVESATGRGTTFSIYLPTADTPSAKVPAYINTDHGGNEHILFVDDEKMLSDLYQSMLSKLGYNVTTFTDSTQALVQFKASPDRFDIVLTDQSMPNLTGLELSKEILKIRNNIPIILCTGYSKFVDEKTAKEAGIRDFCLKPLSKNEIARKIRYHLDISPIAVGR
jgi:CheY-like chemotaxis protein